LAVWRAIYTVTFYKCCPYLFQTEEEMSRYQLTIQEASRQLGVLRSEKAELEQQQAIFKEKEEHAHNLFQEAQTKLSKAFC
jgi:hypothetical protein